MDNDMVMLPITELDRLHGENRLLRDQLRNLIGWGYGTDASDQCKRDWRAAEDVLNSLECTTK